MRKKKEFEEYFTRMFVEELGRKLIAKGFYEDNGFREHGSTPAGFSDPFFAVSSLQGEYWRQYCKTLPNEGEIKVFLLSENNKKTWSLSVEKSYTPPTEKMMQYILKPLPEGW